MRCRDSTSPACSARGVSSPPLRLAGGDELGERANAAGVEWMVCVGTDAATSQEAFTFVGRHPTVQPTAGLHPHDASKLATERAMLERLGRSDACVAIGECGF